VVGNATGLQSFSRHGHGFNRGTDRRPPKQFVPYDTCARCGEKRHWKIQCPHKVYRLPPQSQSSEMDLPTADTNQSRVLWLYGGGTPHTYVEVDLPVVRYLLWLIRNVKYLSDCTSIVRMLTLCPLMWSCMLLMGQNKSGWENLTEFFSSG